MMNRGEEIRKEITAFKVEREKWQPFKQPAKANPGQTQQQLEPATSADTTLLTGNGSGPAIMQWMVIRSKTWPKAYFYLALLQVLYQ